MHLNLPELVHRAPCTRLKRCSWRRFGPVEPPRTEVYVPCSNCGKVVREGSMRFAVLEPLPTSAFSSLHSCSWRRFGPVEPPRTRVKEVYLSEFLPPLLSPSQSAIYPLTLRKSEFLPPLLSLPPRVLSIPSHYDTLSPPCH